MGSQFALKSRFFFSFWPVRAFVSVVPGCNFDLWNFHTRMPCMNYFPLMQQLKPTVFQFLCANNDSSNNSSKMLWDPKTQRFLNVDSDHPHLDSPTFVHALVRFCFHSFWTIRVMPACLSCFASDASSGFLFKKMHCFSLRCVFFI